MVFQKRKAMVHDQYAAVFYLFERLNDLKWKHVTRKVVDTIESYNFKNHLNPRYMK